MGSDPEKTDRTQEEYREAVRCLEDIPRFTKKNSLSHTRQFLRRLGDPQKDFPFLHVAGTNGKGSCCAFLDAAFREAGYSCGLFTSPHLVETTERFRLNAEPVSREKFVKAFRTVRELSVQMQAEGWEHPTYFEMLFLMAMVLFSEEKVDVAVLETGLGGRLDATTAAGDPAACVITSISLDHQEYLGNTVEQIAWEKAGILVRDVPAVYDGLDGRAAGVIAGQAEALGIEAVCLKENDVHVRSACFDRLLFSLSKEQLDRFFPGEETGIDREETGMFLIPFGAAWQARNAALAVLALGASRRRFSRLDLKAAARGLAKTRWEGRLERLSPGIVLDGAHNEDGIRQLVGTVRDLWKEKPVRLLFSVVSDKDCLTMVRLLLELPLSHVTVTEVGGGRKLSAFRVREAFASHGVMAEAVPDPAAAFKKASREKREDELLLCTGSLYLVGALKKIAGEAGSDDRL